MFRKLKGELQFIDNQIRPKIKDKPEIPNIFWCKNYKGNENCCFNHWIGLPQKDGIAHPLYSYEEELFSDIEKYNFLAIVKATGLGITEFFLRYAEHQCLVKYENAQVVVLTGPNIDLAKMQISRIKNIF